MKIIVEFQDGTYRKKCQKFPEKIVGSVLCVGHHEVGISKCEFCQSFKQENTYELIILNEITPIVSEVECSADDFQLSIFD